MSVIRRVLLVEDSEADQLIGRIAVETFDPTVELMVAHDGQAALELLAQAEAPPDLILLDINMPGMGGHAFLAEFTKSHTPTSVVAMLTSSAQESDKQRCLRYPCVVDYIVKPLEPGDLERLSTLLASK